MFVARYCGRTGTRTPDFYCVILNALIPATPIYPFCAFLSVFCIFQGCKYPLSPIFPWRFILIATLSQHLRGSTCVIVEPLK
jgi:hypothetical protein